jgi:hypothetical protein
LCLIRTLQLHLQLLLLLGVVVVCARAWVGAVLRGIDLYGQVIAVSRPVLMEVLLTIRLLLVLYLLLMQIVLQAHRLLLPLKLFEVVYRRRKMLLVQVLR